ncbi:MAG: hypothetical protein AAF915_24645 [Cyanobacteria bacterium P01_D01_bin.50]
MKLPWDMGFRHRVVARVSFATFTKQLSIRNYSNESLRERN